MKAIILAAGRGSRLKDHTQNQPKCLNQVCGRPMIEWIISALKSGGVNDITLVTGYQAQMLDYLGLRTVYNPDWETTNMVVSLSCALDEISGPVIVSYSDIIYNPSAVKLLLETENEFQILYDPNWLELWESRFENPLCDAESFIIDDNNQIMEIGQPVNDLSLVQGQYMGLMKFSSSGIDHIIQYLSGKEYKKMDMTSLLCSMIKYGFAMHGTAYHDRWVEVDTPEDLKLASIIFKE